MLMTRRHFIIHPLAKMREIVRMVYEKNKCNYRRLSRRGENKRNFREGKNNQEVISLISDDILLEVSLPARPSRRR